jgi:DNA-binding NarL/FixJ family response regulator
VRLWAVCSPLTWPFPRRSPDCALADKEIAAELGTSAKTAQFHVANLLDKLGAQNRTDAVRIAYARGLLDV